MKIYENCLVNAKCNDYMKLWYEVSVIVTWLYGTKEDHIKQSRLTRCSTTLKQKRFQNFFNSIGLILNSIKGHLTVLNLKKEAVGL